MSFTDKDWQALDKIEVAIMRTKAMMLCTKKGAIKYNPTLLKELDIEIQAYLSELSL